MKNITSMDVKSGSLMRIDHMTRMVDPKRGVTIESILRTGDGAKEIRLDNVGQPVFLGQQVEMLMAGYFETKRPVLDYQKLLTGPLMVIDAGYVQLKYGMTQGNARIVNMAGNETGAPLSSVSAGYATVTLSSWIGAYSYNLRQTQIQGVVSGFDPAAMEMAALMRAFDDNQNKLKLLGDSNFAIEGLYSIVGANATTVPTGTGGLTWTTKTSLEIYSDLILMADRVATLTSFVGKSPVIVLPTVRYNLINSKLTTSQERSALELFKAARPEVKIMTDDRFLNAAGLGGTMRAVAYDPEKIYRVDGYDPEPIAPQETGLVTTVHFHTRQGGVFTPYPAEVAYIDGF
jgi:hypothetical protein